MSTSASPAPCLHAHPPGEITLMAAKSSDGPHSREEAGNDAPVPSGPQRTLLIVDDQPSVCASIAYYLQVCGYRALRAESGQAAIELARKEEVDGVLLDIQMPVLNGFQTCMKLQELARETNRQFKIWFMTGAYHRGLQEECERVGAVSVFRKPFNWPELLAALEKGLSLLPPPANSAIAPDPEST